MTAKTAAQPPDVEQGFGYKFVLCLRDRNSTAAVLGASKVGTTAAFGVKVTRPIGRGSEERRLYFDAETGLLLKSELHARLSTGGELASEQTWADWKMIDGIAVPHRVTNSIRDAGGTVHERVFTDFKFADKLDPKLFARPRGGRTRRLSYLNGTAWNRRRGSRVEPRKGISKPDSGLSKPARPGDRDRQISKTSQLEYEFVAAAIEVF